MKERDEAKNLFKSKKGKEIQKEINKRAKTFIPGGNMNNVAKTKGMNLYLNRVCWIFNLCFVGLTDDEVRKIREAINRASSLEEVERLQKILQSGQIPDHDFNTSKIG